ncbi:hypothetical protein [Shumkonia mesophila]|uniref:hypothetical protein n=1 Tax=Shumkonia mesophila TaxID=2838854 RepID=UPI002934B139|nr:hypothetical protein [Shumkonia mesophila]
MPRFRYVPKILSRASSVPFANAEEAWFWFVRCHRVRREGARLSGGPVDTVRPCDPDDIYRAVRHLARTGRIGQGHLRVLAHFGLRETPPDARSPEEIQAARLWTESLDRLTTVLRGKAIVS